MGGIIVGGMPLFKIMGVEEKGVSEWHYSGIYVMYIWGLGGLYTTI